MTTTEPALDAKVTRLVRLLELTEVGPDRFLGPGGELNLPRIFGGQVLAQALVAAGRTVDRAKAAHSLHGYFLRAGDPHDPVEYQVERVRDGRRLASRAVTARQGGSVLATMTASFAATAGGVEHQRSAPRTPPPEQVPTLAEASQAWGGLSGSWSDFAAWEIRVDPRTLGPEPGTDPARWTDHVWQRVPGPLAADPLLHQALLVYASDFMQLASALVPHGVPLGCEEVAGQAWDGVSLDHAVWFHRPVRADQWLLFEQYSPVAAAGRALTRAEVFTPAGELVASVAQEGLIFDLGKLAHPSTPGA